MKPLSHILQQHLTHSNLWKGTTAARVVMTANNWLKSFFANNILDHAQAISFKNGILIIACNSSVTAQEIKLNEAALYNAIANIFSSSILKKITYMSGGIPKTSYLAKFDIKV